MSETLGTIIFGENKIVLKYNDGYKEVFEKEKSSGNDSSQWIVWNGERFYLKEK